MRTSFASAPGRRVSAGVAQLIIVALLGALAIAPAALAEAAGTAALRSEQQALLKRTFKEPANLDVAFRYAEVSTQLNDFEAAIGALERMLFFNAKLPRVQLELGVLYFRSAPTKWPRAISRMPSPIQPHHHRFVTRFRPTSTRSKSG